MSIVQSDVVRQSVIKDILSNSDKIKEMGTIQFIREKMFYLNYLMTITPTLEKDLTEMYTEEINNHIYGKTSDDQVGRRVEGGAI